MNQAARRRLSSSVLILILGLSLAEGWAQTVPPYAVGFETANGVSTGNLNGQNGWTVAQGTATVTAAQAFSGANSVLLASGTPPAQITRAFGAPASGSLTYTDFFAQPNTDWTLGGSTVFDVEGSRIGSVRLGSQGQILAMDGNGTGGGRWVVTGKTIPVDSNGRAVNWVRFTVRQNYSTKKWDLYVDAAMVAHDLGFRDNTKTYLSLFKLTASPASSSYFDDFYAGAGNPLFTDADGDGLEDAWETSRGLNPATDDRTADHDSDGLSNLEEYILGTNPNATDSDADGLPDEWEVDHGTNPLVNDAASDPGEVGRTLLQSYTGSLSPWPVPAVTSGLQVWYRADKGVVKNGSNRVSQWTDMSGHGVHLVQNTSDAKPAYVATGMNGQPALEFVYEQLMMSGGFLDLLQGSNDASVVLVLKPAAQQNNYTTILAHSENGLKVQQYENATNHYTLSWKPWNFGGGVNAPAGSVRVVSEVMTAGGNIRGYLDGLLQTTSAIGSEGVDPQPGRLALGSHTTGNQWYRGQIAEVLVYNRVLTNTEREAVETALLAKYVNPDADADGLPDTWEDQYLGTRSYGASDDPGAVGRTLLQSYTGNLNPWPAASVSSGLRVWYRADKGVIKNGSNQVGVWTDVSGHGVHLLQSSADAKPAYVTAAMNGQPALEFTYQQMMMSGAAFDLLQSSNNASVIVVLKPAAQQNNYTTILAHSENGLKIQQYDNATNQYALSWKPWNFGGGVNASAGSVRVLSEVMTAGGNIRGYLNGLLQTTDAIGSEGVDPQPGRVALGSHTTGNQWYRGQIAEVLVYNRALTNTEREAIEAALLTKYVNPDADADGLPDTWEDQYLGTRSYGASADPGGVGRTLLQSYTGSLNPWPVPTVASGLRVWYRADKGVIKNGSNQVSGWTDVSGHGVHGLAAGSAQPAYVASAMNGQPAVEFASQQWMLSEAAVDLLQGSNDASVIVVLKPEAVQGDYTVVLAHAENGLRVEQDGNASNQYALSWKPWSFGGGVNASGGGVKVLSEVMTAGVNIRGYLNGVLASTSALGNEGVNPQAGRLSLAATVGNHQWYHGQIAEVLVYNRALNNTERAAIEAALVAKYITGEALADSDGDGLPDAWEQQHFGGLSHGAAEDLDTDGLSNLQEYQAGTNPTTADTDADGMKDGRELLFGRNPLKGVVPDTTHAVDLKIFQPTR